LSVSSSRVSKARPGLIGTLIRTGSEIGEQVSWSMLGFRPSLNVADVAAYTPSRRNRRIPRHGGGPAMAPVALATKLTGAALLSGACAGMSGVLKTDSGCPSPSRLRATHRRVPRKPGSSHYDGKEWSVEGDDELASSTRKFRPSVCCKAALSVSIESWIHEWQNGDSRERCVPTGQRASWRSSRRVRRRSKTRRWIAERGGRGTTAVAAVRSRRGEGSAARVEPVIARYPYFESVLSTFDHDRSTNQRFHCHQLRPASPPRVLVRLTAGDSLAGCCVALRWPGRGACANTEASHNRRESLRLILETEFC